MTLPSPSAGTETATIRCECCQGFGTIITDVYGPMMFREIECPLCSGTGREPADVVSRREYRKSVDALNHITDADIERTGREPSDIKPRQTGERK